MVNDKKKLLTKCKKYINIRANIIQNIKSVPISVQIVLTTCDGEKNRRTITILNYFKLKLLPLSIMEMFA